MKVQYIGPCAGGVEIAATGQVVAPGGVVDVPDDLGALLCEQESNWTPATGPAKKPVKGEE